MNGRRTSLFSSVALLFAFVACHHAAAPQTTAAPSARSTSNTDNADAQARRDAARRDSISNAEAARRAAARAAADQQARDAAAAARSAIVARIFFEYQRDELRQDAIATLDAKVAVLRAHPALRIRVDGNADERGSDEYNLALGQRRSAAAKRYLVERGIGAARIDAVSYGEERPACRGGGESCWHENRRDEFEIIAGGDALGAGQR